ncbi:TPA: ribosome-associated translation inhibitor RaiA [Patescibacteria group bacterium]|nr:MAG: Sigma 54 modulation protein/ribosomal protein S30EA [Parcubacteria group bacterium GW2011_GWA2_46_39]HCU47925.1 ribosome-associated translation inhibitor RaiA [Patescibacteria group bacterium]
MNIIVGAKNFKLTPALTSYVEDKIRKLEHFWGRIIRANVELSTARVKSAGEQAHVRVWLEVPGPDIEAEVEGPDMYAAIDLVMPKLERQIGRARGKAKAMSRRPRR